MNYFDFIKRIFRLAHLDVAFFPSDKSLRRRMELLKLYQITTILDVGANEGQYCREMRELGYRGKFISFEPQSAAFSLLKKNSETDAGWTIHNYGLGNAISTVDINISQNSYSSSVLGMMPAHLASAPQSVYVRKETVTIRTLDSVFKEFYNSAEVYFLKIDTQGFEKHVLDGAVTTLPHIRGIQLEMSLVELYQGGALFRELDSFLNANGFYLCNIEPEFDDPVTKRLLQINGTYFKLN